MLASMDVKPEPVAAPVTEAPQPKPAPVMDVVPPPATPALEPVGAANVPDMPSSIVPDPSKKDAKAPAKPGAAKQPGNGVTIAIISTVIIVLALSALAVYAYTKTAK